MTQDTRKDQRAKIVSLNVRYKSATVDEFIENHSHDVSKGGIFIKTPTPFAPGTLLKLELRIAGDDKAVIVGVGRAVWKREPARASADAPAGMGVKFIKIDEASRRLIDRVVAEKIGAGSAYRSEREESGRPTSDGPARLMPSARPSAPPSSGAARGFERKTTMRGIHSPLPPTPRGGYGPAGRSPSMFPPSRGDSNAPPPGERTVMKQAAELLEEALKEAGGSMAEVGHHSSFLPGGSASGRPSARDPLEEKQTLIGMPSARPPQAAEPDEAARSGNAHTRKTAPPPAGIPTPRSLARAAISIPPDALVEDRESRDRIHDSGPGLTQRSVSAALGTGMGSAGGLLAEPASLPAPPRTPSMTLPLSKRSPPPVPPGAPAPKALSAPASGRLALASMPPSGKRVHPVIWLALGVVGVAAVAFASRDAFHTAKGPEDPSKPAVSAEAASSEGPGEEPPPVVAPEPSSVGAAVASLDAGVRQALAEASAPSPSASVSVTPPTPPRPAALPATLATAPAAPRATSVAAPVAPRPSPVAASATPLAVREPPVDTPSEPASDSGASSDTATVTALTAPSASPTQAAPHAPTAPSAAPAGNGDASDNPY